MKQVVFLVSFGKTTLYQQLYILPELTYNFENKNIEIKFLVLKFSRTYAKSIHAKTYLLNNAHF